VAADYLEILNQDRTGPDHAAATTTATGAYAEPKMKKKARRPTSRMGSSTRTSTEVRSPTSTSTKAYTQGNFTATTTGGAGAGDTTVHIHAREPKMKKKSKSVRKGRKLSKAARREISMRNLKKAHRARRHAPKLVRAARANRRLGMTKHKRLTVRHATRSTAREAPMRKKKQSAKQKAASLRNLKKARASRRRTVSSRIAKSGHSKHMPKWKKKSVRKAARTSKAKKSRKITKRAKPRIVAAPRAPKRPRRKAARKSPKRSAARRRNRRGGKLTKAQRRVISMRNLGKARSARRRNKRAGKRHPVRSYSYRAKARKVRVPRHMSWEAKEGRKPRRKKGRRRQTMKQRAASLRNLKKARSARKSATRRHPVKRYSYSRKGGTRRVKRHMSYEYAMENPMGGVELFVAGVSGIVWFGVTDLVDRIVATHALTDKNSKDAAGHELYADSPPTTGSYANLFNPTAICAPMNLARWGAGLGMTFAPIIVAKWITNPIGRSVFQVAGFGGGMRIFGKALIDLIAKLTMWTQSGQRLFDGEMRAMSLKAGDTNTASLPSAGLGAVTCECTNCRSGVGVCEAEGVGKPANQTGTGAGWPGMPRETANGGGGTSTSANAPNAPPPPAPPSLTSPAPSLDLSTLRGAPGMAGVPLKPRNPYAWGKEEAAA
jgi:hypothetical protein